MRTYYGYREFSCRLRGNVNLFIRHFHNGTVEIICAEQGDIGRKTQLSDAQAADLRWVFANQRIIIEGEEHP
jgi:hypothetical protein